MDVEEYVCYFGVFQHFQSVEADIEHSNKVWRILNAYR